MIARISVFSVSDEMLRVMQQTERQQVDREIREAYGPVGGLIGHWLGDNLGQVMFGLLLKATNVPCQGCETLTDMAAKSATVQHTHTHTTDIIWHFAITLRHNKQFEQM